MDSALDNAEDLKTLLTNFVGEVYDLDEYLADKYLEEIGITDEALMSYAVLCTTPSTTKQKDYRLVTIQHFTIGIPR